MDMPALNFDLVSTSFLNHLTIERGLSAHTIAAYRRDLMKFENFLNGKALADVDPQTIADFEVSLKTAQASPASISRINSTLRSFFKHAISEFGIANPTFEMSPSQSINIADIASAQSSDGEITTLKLRGKGSKERIVPLGSFATKAITDYLVRIRPMLASKNSKTNTALFLNSRGARLTRQSAWNMVIRAAKDAGIEAHVSPHVFRHSYATHLLDGGADIRVVQELLGHASVTTTQIYTLITIDKVRESYSLAHPRARG